MLRFALVVEGIHLQPAVIGGKTGGPDDRGHAGLGQVQLQDRIGHALGIGEGYPRFRFLRQVQAVALDVGIGGIEQRQIVLIAPGQVLGQVRLESRHSAVERLGQADQGHAAMGKPAKVHGPPAMSATDGNGHVFPTGLHRRLIPFAQHPQPPAEITVAVGAGRAIVGAYREVDLLARTLQLVGNLHPRRAGADDQNGAFWQLPRVAVISRVDL